MLRFTKSSNPGTSKTGWHCDWPLNATSIISQDVQLLYSYWWIHISTKASLVSSANSRRYSAAPVKLVSCPAILTRVWLEKRPTNLWVHAADGINRKCSSIIIYIYICIDRGCSTATFDDTGGYISLILCIIPFLLDPKCICRRYPELVVETPRILPHLMIQDISYDPSIENIT